jgi:TolB protein
VTLLSASGSNIDGPAFSPDGKRIAFSNAASNGDQELFVKSLVDGSVKRLTYSTGDDLWPTWSPDSKIVFGSTRNGRFQIWSVSDTGGSATRLSHNSYTEKTPAYSY